MNICKPALIEAGKEFLRIMLIAVVITVIPQILMGINRETGVISIKWGVVYAGFLSDCLIGVAKGLDMYVHKNEDIKANGIIPF